MDIDLLRRGIADQAVLVQFVEQCAEIEDFSDGVMFKPSTISVESIRDATEYVGTRIRLQAHLAKVRQTVQIDFGVGDAVHPQPQVIEYPVLLTNSPIRLHAYPVEAAIAEKFHAMVELDLRNSRMKDFYDIWILSRTLAFSGHGLSQAIRSTFQRRQTSVPSLVPVGLTAEFYGDPIHVRQWGAFVRRIGEATLADDFARIAGGLVRCGRGGGHIGGPWTPLGASRPMAVDRAQFRATSYNRIYTEQRIFGPNISRDFVQYPSRTCDSNPSPNHHPKTRSAATNTIVAAV
jgi:hypothetical protein